MGARGNIRIDFNDGGHTYFYGHWSGSEMFNILRDALQRGRPRWDDEPYLARIIFCELVKNDLAGLTGYGISPYLCDNEYKIFTVNSEKKTVGMVTERGESLNEWSFEEFIALSADPRSGG